MTSVGSSSQATSVASLVNFEFADCHDVGHERIEEPLLLALRPVLRVMMAELAQLLARFDAELDAAVPEHLACFALVNLGIHVERRE